MLICLARQMEKISQRPIRVLSMRLMLVVAANNNLRAGDRAVGEKVVIVQSGRHSEHEMVLS